MKLIHKNNAEYYRNTILVGNCNDTLNINNMWVHLLLAMHFQLKTKMSSQKTLFCIEKIRCT